MYDVKVFTRRTDRRCPFDDTDLSGEDLYGLAHVIGWEPYDLHDLMHVSWVGSVLFICRSCAASHSGRYMIYVIYMICMICMIYICMKYI